jgi:hypothetical protein
MWILENYRKIRENPVKNLVHDRYRKIHDERSTGKIQGVSWTRQADLGEIQGDIGDTKETQEASWAIQAEPKKI